MRSAAVGRDFERVVQQRRAEADEFYAELTPPQASADEALVMRQAFSGMLWSKQLYNYDVDRWLEGDPTQPTPPAARQYGRNSRWRNFDAFDIMSMPDKWEYPWFAAWDLALHCVTLAHVDPAFAKYQLILLCREWFQHPNGALPAYEWDFGDVNPPVQAWAALEVFVIDGAQDFDFLSRVFDKLLMNFTWWVNLEDAGGNNLFEGGFLGLDNIGPIDRSHLPAGGVLEQSDATGWMAFYAIAMAGIAGALQWGGGRSASDLVLKFLEHVAAIHTAIDKHAMWDDADGMYYDQLLPAGRSRRAGEGSLDGRDPAAAGGRHHRRGAAGQVPRRRQELCHVAAPSGLQQPRATSGAWAHPRREGQPAAAAERGRYRAATEAIQQALRRGRVPVALRSARPVGLPSRAPLPARAPTGSAPPSTTSRPSRRRRCSVGTPTGEARCGSRSTICWWARSSATTGSSATS